MNCVSTGRTYTFLFCHFWLDPKVTKRSRLRALRTPSLRSQVGKSGNSLRFGQPDFLLPCSLLRRLTARGRMTNAHINVNCQLLCRVHAGSCTR
ncbi:hypothetical protein EII40_01135 [Tannerella forsythia]|uniref:Uncharacterized protein n=1 Tax=Tannerella forsythia TaxID=28112 RepID=A0A3P1XVW2_TANFO|nr:hypothetical protein EII40_01135 [Tannerella forsythia]